MPQKILSGAIVFILLASSLTLTLSTSRTVAAPTSRGFSTYTWEDHFLDSSLIDPDLSSGFQLQDSNISMLYTFPAWTAYPAWERIRPISLNNTGSAITEALIRIVVPYDSSMQPDFDDLRFASATGDPLLYTKVVYTDSISAIVLIKIPSLPHGVTTIYLFYRNPQAPDGSSPLLTWTKVTVDDVRISYVGPTEGCWDPAIAHGVNQFLTTWEEGAPPQTSQDESHRLIHREIHGRLYDGNGANPDPVPSTGDIEISPTTSGTHAENPSVAYSPPTSFYFVTWEENPTVARYAIGIHAAIVRASDHFVYSPVTVDDPDYSALVYYPDRNPCVAFDDQSDRFLIVWSKCDINSNIDVMGRLYTSMGIEIGSSFTIAGGSGYQGQPFVTSDNLGHFLVTYENGTSGTNGPISIKSVLLNSNGAPVSSFYTLEQGSSANDFIFPAAAYNPVSQTYLVSWNSGDVSASDYSGRIDAVRLTNSGVPSGNVMLVRSSTIAKISSVVPYLSTNFLVSYDYLGKIYGRIVSVDGAPVDNEFQMVDSLASNADYSVLAVNGTNVFAIWEDERNGFFTEIFGSVWRSDQTLAAPSTGFGSESPLLLDAQLTSVPIMPDYFVHWKNFAVTCALNGCTVNFRLLDANATTVLKNWMTNGEDISMVTDPVVRVQALMHRDVASTTPFLDYWNVTALVGGDLEAPWTNLTMYPPAPNGDHGWYTGPVQMTLLAFDDDSPPENVSTYYRVDGGDVMNYSGPFNVTSEQANNTVEYWSMDRAGNEELPHHLLTGVNIDATAPTVEILGPDLVIFPGVATIQVTSLELLSGSGIDLVVIKLNDEAVDNVSFSQAVWANVSWNFSAAVGDSFEIKVEVHDHAGNIGIDARSISVSEYGLYVPGYVYWFDNPKIGPVYPLQRADMAVVVNYNTLHVVLHDIVPGAVSAEFVARRQMLGINVTPFYDMNLEDGVSYDMPLPLGVYQISVTLFNLQNEPIYHAVLIYKILVILPKTASP